MLLRRACRDRQHRLLVPGVPLPLAGALLLLAAPAHGQTVEVAPKGSTRTATSFLVPQAGLWLPLTKRLELRNYSSYLAGDQHGVSVIVDLVFTLNRYFSLTPSYFGYYQPRLADGTRPLDRRVRLAGTFTWPLPHAGLSNRTLVERRFQQTQTSMRYRNLLRLEDSLHVGRFRFTVYAANEGFYDESVRHWTLNQVIFGLTHPLTRRLTGEVYYTHQALWRSADANLYALAFTVRLPRR